MKRRYLILAASLLGLLVSGCVIFPYASDTQINLTQVIATSTSTVEPTSTKAISTATLGTVFSPTPTDLPEMPTVTPTALSLAFVLQEGNPLYLPNFTHPDAGCAWLGLAGQVFDAQGNELLDLTILAGDIQNASEDPICVKTGTALAYGLGGYEIQLSATPVASSERFWIQVYDPNGLPLTDKIFFTTFEDCNQNLVLINLISVDNNRSTGKSELMSTPILEAYP